jgi:hypothetical protein
MNERFWKIYGESIIGVNEDGGDVVDPIKFAQLIISECAGVCEDYRGTEWGKAAECIGDSIKEHFGVEE